MKYETFKRQKGNLRLFFWKIKFNIQFEFSISQIEIWEYWPLFETKNCPLINEIWDFDIRDPKIERKWWIVKPEILMWKQKKFELFQLWN